MSTQTFALCFLAVLLLLSESLATNREALGKCTKALKKTGKMPHVSLSYLRHYGARRSSHESAEHRRRLLQEVSCEWDAEEKECIVADATLAELLLGSNSSLGQFMGQLSDCTPQTSESTCLERDYCAWSRPECIYVGYASENADSPCTKHAPGLVSFFDAAELCATFEKEATCNAHTCQWDLLMEECNADVLEIFFPDEDLEADNIDDLIDNVEAEGDRKLLTTLFECSSTNISSSCTGSCEWNPSSNICGITRPALLNSTIPSGDISGDGLCELFSFFAQDTCYSYDTKKECLLNDTCSYNEDGCGPDAALLVLKIAEEDPDFILQMLDSARICNRFDKPRICK